MMFVNKPPDNSLRSEIEKRLVSAATAIPQREAAYDCYDKVAVETFFSMWDNLVRYYEETGDTVIGVEVVREYIDWLSRFSTAWHDEKSSEECHAWAMDACYELEYYMDEIIKAVERRLYPQGR